MLRLFLFTLLSFTLPGFASEKLLLLPTREGVSIPVYLIQPDQAKATLILLPGGAGGLGKMKAGQPDSNNFLVRSRNEFANAGFNVAVMGRASDKSDLDTTDRIASEHMQDIQMLVAYLKKEADLPIWLIGTSRGTVSATAAAIALGNEALAGIVLSSSMTSSKKAGAVPTQELAKIHIPVLVIHHEKDACKFCMPSEVPIILTGLHNAPVKKLIMMSGGDSPTGGECEALHYHGYIGVERATVLTITDWINRPVP